MINAQVALIDCGSAKFGAIAEIVGSDSVSVKLDAANTFESGPMRAMIISGGPHLFTGSEGASLRSKFAFLERIRIPVLGICLGHQALVLEAGGDVYLGEERRTSDGIRLEQPDHPLFQGIDDGTQFAEDHCEGGTVPTGYTLLGSSAFYRNEAMANDKDRRYGVQFHPEISGEPGRRLIENFLALAAT